MKISEIITDKYKLRIPPTVYYDLLADVQEAEEEQEHILDKIRAEIQENINYNKKMNYQGIVAGLLLTLNIIDKYKAEVESQESEGT